MQLTLLGKCKSCRLTVPLSGIFLQFVVRAFSSQQTSKMKETKPWLKCYIVHMSKPSWELKKVAKSNLPIYF